MSGAGASIEADLKQAEQFLRGGRLQEAEQLCRSVLQQGENPLAFQILGAALARRGDLPNAEAALRRSIALAARSGSAHTNLGNLLYLKRDFAGAEKAYRQALALSPGQPEAHYNLGLALKSLNRINEAIETLRAAIRLRPNYADACIQLGTTLLAANDPGEALAAFDSALALKQDNFEVHYNRGLALMGLKRFEDAVQSLARAGAHKNASHEAFYALGLALRRLRRFSLAVPALARAAMLKPDSAEIHAALASALLDLGQPDASLEEINKALALDDRHADYHIILGRSLADLQRLDEAIVAHEKAVALAPSSPEPLNFLGNVYMSIGRFADARTMFERALKLDPENPNTHYHLAQAPRFEPGDGRLPALEALARKSASFDPEGQTRIHFALGKAYDDLGEYDRAFAEFRAGNTARARSETDMDAAFERRSQAISSVFSPEFIRTHSGSGSSSAMPIFVLGMPRSGTTLVEQIIASHPDVSGAGELIEFEQAMASVRKRHNLNKAYPEDVVQMPPHVIGEIGEAYVTRIARFALGARHVTDKLPSNFLYLGLIALALPNARIIHCRRDPLDTCVSCYSNLFGHRLGFVNDLELLGRSYRAYASLMSHWRRVLPEGAFLDVQYEELVGSFEKGARRIIAYCGLQWDQKCLEFYKAERQVKTLSIAQVREPIYRSSVGRWRRYEKHLGPLVAALGDLVKPAKPL